LGGAILTQSNYAKIEANPSDPRARETLSVPWKVRRFRRSEFLMKNVLGSPFVGLRKGEDFKHV
jgi:hypothetical protein